MQPGDVRYELSFGRIVINRGRLDKPKLTIS